MLGIPRLYGDFLIDAQLCDLFIVDCLLILLGSVACRYHYIVLRLLGKEIVKHPVKHGNRALVELYRVVLDFVRT